MDDNKKAIAEALDALRTSLAETNDIIEISEKAKKTVPAFMLTERDRLQAQIVNMEIDEKFPAVKAKLENILEPFVKRAPATINFDLPTTPENIENLIIATEAKLAGLKVIQKDASIFGGRPVQISLTVTEGVDEKGEPATARKVHASLSGGNTPKKERAPKSSSEGDSESAGSKGNPVKVNGVEYNNATAATKSLNIFDAGNSQVRVLRSKFDEVGGKGTFDFRTKTA